MSNVLELNTTPSNPAMAEAFRKAATKDLSPELGGDTLQAELANMERAKTEPESNTARLAKTLAGMTSSVKDMNETLHEAAGVNTMHHTDGADNMFSEVEEMIEPEFTGSHGRVKAMALLSAGSLIATTATAALFTRNSKTVKSVAVTGLLTSSMLIGMEAIQAKRNPSVADRLVMGKKRAAKLLGGGLAIGAATMSIGLTVGRIFNSGE
ncbi:hypothetical protein RAY_139 [Erwinia phage vB_EamM_RAY]|uniref:Uncharacterized protein n=2 Tax=Agricanvirus TaxID=1984776 RepID=A0A173GE64_9CAUD|nr:hypothetical protein FDH98_gp139 [Erwinia phage vB_EamM_RAY]YP_009605926.1 hypothetical protein FDH99_gp142 [Erwinia phage vB_EamM_Simmy50]ANH51604.1 hypothetical protein SIMMY50_142 [Erwinia phage vB_EamM_Simmy50]ANH51920.1 hypothetical protein RAY_139 [Erwinia phage vB_EamM_RAY]